MEFLLVALVLGALASLPFDFGRKLWLPKMGITFAALTVTYAIWAYVDPPQLTRLGLRLGLPETVRNQEEFLNAYKKHIA